MATFHPKLNTAESMEPMDPSKMDQDFSWKNGPSWSSSKLKYLCSFLGIRLSQIYDEYMMYVVYMMDGFLNIEKQ